VCDYGETIMTNDQNGCDYAVHMIGQARNGIGVVKGLMYKDGGCDDDWGAVPQGCSVQSFMSDNLYEGFAKIANPYWQPFLHIGESSSCAEGSGDFQLVCSPNDQHADVWHLAPP